MRHEETKESFRDLLATSGVHKIVVNAIRSQRAYPDCTPHDIKILETLRGELRKSSTSLRHSLAEVA